MRRLLDDLRQDLRTARRSLLRARGVTLLVVGTLAVGVAVVTTTFSFLNSALYRALPYPLADRSVAIIATRSDWPGNLPPAMVEALRHNARSFSRVSAFYDHSARLEVGNTIQTVTATAVDTGFFATLGAHPERGRFPSASEIAQAAPYAVISHRFWHAQLNGDPDAVGRSLRFGPTLYTIVGVMPPHINYGMAGNTDVWVPQPAVADSDSYYFAFAWLKPGVTLAQTRAEVSTISFRVVRSNPQRYHRLDAYVNDEMVIRRMEGYKPALLLFLGAAACVLLIGCANVTTLMLMRATERRREMAVRASLGASRLRLVRQSTTESLVLALGAAILGTVLAVACIRVAGAAFPNGFATWFQLGIDTHVLAFIVGLVVTIVMLVGLTPALEGTRFDVSAALKAGGGLGATSARTLRSGQRAIGVQVAVAVTLIVIASLLGTSYWNTLGVQRGYDADHVLNVFLDLGSDQGKMLAVDRRLSTAMTSSPGITAVAHLGFFWHFQAPDTASNANDTLFLGDASAPALALGRSQFIHTQMVSDNYFATMRIPLLRGRTFAPSDTTGTPLVAVLSERVARAIWGGRGEVGRTLRLGRNGSPITVIGVAGDVHDPRATPGGISTNGLLDVYFSERQGIGNGTELLVRTAGSTGAGTRAITAAIRTAAPEVQGFSIRPYSQTADDVSLVLRLFGSVIGTCALIALALSLVGIYGVVGFSVAQRTREIGIRMALGGTIAQIRAHVMRGGMRVAAVGLVIGALLAAGIAQFLRSWMLGVSSVSPAVYLAVCALFGAAAYGAGYIPSRRAARVDPMTALRSE